MFKLVVIRRPGVLTNDQCYKILKDATNFGFKKRWADTDLYYAHERTNLYALTLRDRGLLLVSWYGPEDQYLIAKLSVPRHFIVGQVDVDGSGKLWSQIIDASMRWCTDLKILPTHDGIKQEMLLNDMNSYLKTIYKNFQIILAPIADKLQG